MLLSAFLRHSVEENYIVWFIMTPKVLSQSKLVFLFYITVGCTGCLLSHNIPLTVFYDKVFKYFYREARGKMQVFPSPLSSKCEACQRPHSRGHRLGSRSCTITVLRSSSLATDGQSAKGSSILLTKLTLEMSDRNLLHELDLTQSCWLL